MTRLSNEQIMDFLDGVLSPEEMARVESHLKNSPEDRALVDEIRFATQSLRDFDTLEYGQEPLRVSENFWPHLRDNLGPAPKRGFFRGLWKSFNSAGASKPVARYSVGLAMAGLVVAMAAFMFAPRNSTPSIQAAMTQSDRQFVQQSLKQHETYVQSAPVAGDVSALDSSNDEGDDDANPR